MSITLPQPELQIDFAAALDEIRALYLQDARSKAPAANVEVLKMRKSGCVSTRIEGRDRSRRHWTRYGSSERLSVIRMIHVEDKTPQLRERERHPLGIRAKANIKGSRRRWMQQIEPQICYRPFSWTIKPLS